MTPRLQAVRRDVPPAPRLDPLVDAAIALWLRPRTSRRVGAWTDALSFTLIPEVPMSTQQILKQQFELFYGTARRNLDDMTHEQSLAVPTGGGNSANWILGHLITVQNAVLELLGLEAVWADRSLERVTPDPETLPEGGLDWNEMKSRLFDSEQRCLAGLEAASDARLGESVESPFGGLIPLAEMFGLLAFHQSYHVGQLGLSRRIAGLPGAIRGPRQAAER